MITTDNSQTLVNALKEIDRLRAENEKLHSLRHEREDVISGLRDEIARLKEIESEWMRLSQEDGKAERAIERLTKNLDEQLRINGMGAEREYVCEVSSHWNGASGFDVRDFKVLPPVGTKLYLAPRDLAKESGLDWQKGYTPLFDGCSLMP